MEWDGGRMEGAWIQAFALAESGEAWPGDRPGVFQGEGGCKGESRMKHRSDCHYVYSQ